MSDPRHKHSAISPGSNGGRSSHHFLHPTASRRRHALVLAPTTRSALHKGKHHDHGSSPGTRRTGTQQATPRNVYSNAGIGITPVLIAFGFIFLTVTCLAAINLWEAREEEHGAFKKSILEVMNAVMGKPTQVCVVKPVATPDQRFNRYASRVGSPGAERKDARANAGQEDALKNAKAALDSDMRTVTRARESLRVSRKIFPNFVEKDEKRVADAQQAVTRSREALRRLEAQQETAPAMADEQKYGQAFRQMVEGSVTRHAQAQSKGLFAAWCDAKRLTVETNLETKVAVQIQRKADNYDSVKQALARAVHADARLAQIEQQAVHDARMGEIRRIQEVRDGAQAARSLPSAGYAALPAASPAPLRAIAAPSTAAGDPALTEQVAVAAVLTAEEKGQAATSADFAAFFQDIAPKLRADMPALDLSLVLAHAQQMRRQAYPGT